MLIFSLFCTGISSAFLTAETNFKMNQEVSFKDSTWIVLEARDFGQKLHGHLMTGDKETEGKFIYVRYKVTNKTRSEDQILIVPKLKDSKQRKFDELIESDFYLPEGEKGLTMEALPAGVPKVFSAIYEVAKEANGLCFLARSFDPILKDEIPIALSITEGKGGIINSPSDMRTEIEGAMKDALLDELKNAQQQKQEPSQQPVVIQSDSTSDPFREPQVINPIPQTAKGNLPELKGRLAAINSKMSNDRERFQSALGTINRLTNYKRTPVQEGTQAYQQCLNASKTIQEIEAGVPALKAEKASLEAQISELEK